MIFLFILPFFMLSGFFDRICGCFWWNIWLFLMEYLTLFDGLCGSFWWIIWQNFAFLPCCKKRWGCWMKRLLETRTILHVNSCEKVDFACNLIWTLRKIGIFYMQIPAKRWIWHVIWFGFCERRAYFTCKSLQKGGFGM